MLRHVTQVLVDPVVAVPSGARARSPRPGAALSHSTASRPSAAAKAQAPAMVIFVLFVIFRSLPFVPVATGASRAPQRWGTPRTRRITDPGPGSGRFGSAALKRRASCKPLCLRGFLRFADARRKCDFYAMRRLVLTPHTGPLQGMPSARLSCIPARFQRLVTTRRCWAEWVLWITR